MHRVTMKIQLEGRGYRMDIVTAHVHFDIPTPILKEIPQVCVEAGRILQEIMPSAHVLDIEVMYL